MKNLLLILLTTLLLASCANRDSMHDNRTKTGTKNAKAEKYLNKASGLHITPTTGADSIREAIAILDSAILLDSGYAKAYVLKQCYQTWLGTYQDALQTIYILEKLQPDDPELQSKEGVLHLLRGNHQSAMTALRKSDSLWNLMLDTLSAGNDWALLGILTGMATNLKLLGEEEKANNMYRRILKDSSFDKEKYKGLKETIDTLFLRQSKEEFYHYLIQGSKKDSTPNS